MTAVRNLDPIAVQMRDERRRLGLSLNGAVERVQMAAVVLGSYERGDRQPPLPRLRAWVEGMGHKLLAVPTGRATGATLRIEYAVTYGPNGDGLIECSDEAEAVAIAAHILGSRVVSRTVRVSRWEPAAGGACLVAATEPAPHDLVTSGGKS